MLDELKSIAIFCKVVETGSFRKTAHFFQLSPSVISHHITMLEKKTQVALLYRSTRKLSLTHDGQKLFDSCRPVLTCIENGLNQLTSKKLSGQLTISMGAVLGHSPLTQIIADFSRQHPDVRLDVKVSDDLHDFTKEGIDLGFRVGPLKDSSFKSRLVYRIHRRLVASPKLFEQYPYPKRLDELSSLPWINPSMMPASRDFIDQDGTKQTVMFNTRLRVDSVDMACMLVKKGAGVTSPPDYLVNTSIQHKQLVPLLEGWQMQSLPVFMIWHSNVTSNSLVHHYKEFVLNRVQEFSQSSIDPLLEPKQEPSL